MRWYNVLAIFYIAATFIEATHSIADQAYKIGYEQGQSAGYIDGLTWCQNFHGDEIRAKIEADTIFPLIDFPEDLPLDTIYTREQPNF